MSEIQNYEAQAAKMREGVKANMPPEALQELERLIANVERDVVASALDTGETAPDFTLHQTNSNDDRSLAAALANGPVVLSFYRGQW